MEWSKSASGVECQGVAVEASLEVTRGQLVKQGSVSRSNEQLGFRAADDKKVRCPTAVSLLNTLCRTAYMIQRQ